MINRTYFINVRKTHKNGSGSYSFTTCTASKRSWFPQPLNLYEAMLDNAKERLKEGEEGILEVTAFNRV